MKKNNISTKTSDIINAGEVMNFANCIIKETAETTKACVQADNNTIKELMSQYDKADSLEEKQIILDKVEKISDQTHKKESEFKYFSLKLAGGFLIALGAIYGIGNYSSLKDAIKLLDTAA